MEIKVRYTADIEPLTKIENGDWFDVRAAEDLNLDFLVARKLSLGFAMELPKGYFALLAPRSSTFDKYGVIQTNSVGVIDESYNGNDDIWKVEFLCLKLNGSFIPKGERIAQFKIFKKDEASEELSFVAVDDLENESRGGFGSTGRT